MSITQQQRQSNSRTFLAIFGAFFLLPGLGLLVFQAIPNLHRLFSAQNLGADEFEAIVAAAIVGLLFSLIGGGAVYWGLKKPRDKVELLDGDSPWLGRKKWACASIKDSFALTGGLTWGIAVFWNLITAPALLAFSEELNKGNELIYLVLAFPLVGLFLVIQAIRKTLDWRRFGQMTLTMAPYPGAIGGDVAGTIHLPTALPAGTPFTVALDCVRHYTQGKNSSQSVVWQHRGLFEAQQSSRSTQLPFLFAVPADLPPSSSADSSYHTWTLAVKAELDGIDLVRQLEVPVFPTAEKASASLRLNLKAVSDIASNAAALFANNTGPEQAIVGDHKNKGFGTGVLIGLVFLAIGIGLAYFIGHLQNETALIGFGALFGSIGLAIFSYSMLGYFRRYYLRLAKPLLECRYKSLFGGKLVTLNYQQISAVTTESRGSMTVGNKHYQFFNLGLAFKNGESLRIGERFSRQQAEKTAAALAQQLGVAVTEKSTRPSRLHQ
ncbi:hypothetical protein A9Q89_07540 [Gammaproteobacteria bacterium 53_120_T64]|nr:hypothetical protein A9Q89_07540 [Gammaproteobacteria bacterium 53_120_T64]